MQGGGGQGGRNEKVGEWANTAPEITKTKTSFPLDTYDFTLLDFEKIAGLSPPPPLSKVSGG